MCRKVYIFFSLIIILVFNSCVSSEDSVDVEYSEYDEYREDVPIYYGISSSYDWVFADNPPETTNLSLILGGYNYAEDNKSKTGGFLKVGASLAETRNKEDSDYPDVKYFSWTAGLEVRRTLTSRERNFYLDGLLDLGFYSYEPSVEYQKNEDFYDRLSVISIGAGLSGCIWNRDNFAVFIDPVVGLNLYGDPFFEAITNEKFGYEPFVKFMFKLTYIQNP